mmetsp:Transcript_7857/g.18336  ORF Transcript_7857/g.18336 Transcript_7857/m.18336 type:complete len:432 (-) Transcript_7857:62-1357(-)
MQYDEERAVSSKMVLVSQVWQIAEPVARPPLHWRSLALRVLGVVAAALLCLWEGRGDSTAFSVSSIGVNSAAAEDIASSAWSTGRYVHHPVHFTSMSSSIRRPRLQGEVPYRSDELWRGIRKQPGLEAVVVSSTDVSVPQARTGLVAYLISALEACISSSTWMAGSLASLVPFVQLSSGFAVDWRPFWAGFCESLVVYTVDHIRDMKEAKNNGVGAVSKVSSPHVTSRVLRALAVMGLLGFVGSVAAAPAGRHLTVGATFGLHLLLCITYAKIKPRIPYFKAAYVSICVVFMAVAAPMAYQPALLSGFSLAAFFRLLLLLMSVSFTVENLQDLRDIQEDRAAGVVTLPSGLGAARSGRLLLATLVLGVGVNCALALFRVLPLRVDILVVYLLCMVCAVSFKESTPRRWFQAVLEPLYVSPLLILMIRLLLS